MNKKQENKKRKNDIDRSKNINGKAFETNESSANNKENKSDEEYDGNALQVNENTAGTDK